MAEATNATNTTTTTTTTTTLSPELNLKINSIPIESKYIIGKIPGYNTNILSSAESKYSDYEKNRLLNNLTTIDFRPIGYKLELQSKVFDFITDKIKTLLNGTTEQAKEEGNGIVDNALDSMKTAVEMITTEQFTDLIKNVSNAIASGLDFSRAVADETWQTALNYGELLNEPSDILSSLANGFVIQATNDSTFSENINNSYGKNFFQEKLEGVTQQLLSSPAGQIASFASRAWISYDSTNAITALQKTGEYGLLGSLAGTIMGAKINFPQVWQNADYSSSLNIMLKLISPSGDSESIKKYIKQPLMVLLRSAAPFTLDGVTYGFPLLWSVKAHGIMDLKMATVTSMSITRGGVDTVFNKFDEPLNIDVRIMITPINPGFAQGPNDDYMMTDPSDIISSLSSKIIGTYNDGNVNEDLKIKSIIETEKIFI